MTKYLGKRIKAAEYLGYDVRFNLIIPPLQRTVLKTPFVKNWNCSIIIDPGYILWTRRNI